MHKFIGGNFCCRVDWILVDSVASCQEKRWSHQTLFEHDWICTISLFCFSTYPPPWPGEGCGLKHLVITNHSAGVIYERGSLRACLVCTVWWHVVHQRVNRIGYQHLPGYEMNMKPLYYVSLRTQQIWNSVFLSDRILQAPYCHVKFWVVSGSSPTVRWWIWKRNIPALTLLPFQNLTISLWSAHPANVLFHGWKMIHKPPLRGWLCSSKTQVVECHLFGGY